MSEKYFKDFDNWNRKKKEIDSSNNGPFFNEREIWRCSIGINIDIEMDGKNDLFERPVLILKKINSKSAWILPVTSSFKDNVYIYPLKIIPSNISISQIKSISSKRLLRKDGRISIREYAHVIIRIIYLLTTNNETSPTDEVSDGSRSPKA